VLLRRLAKLSNPRFRPQGESHRRKREDRKGGHAPYHLAIQQSDHAEYGCHDHRGDRDELKPQCGASKLSLTGHPMVMPGSPTNNAALPAGASHPQLPHVGPPPLLA
jgi:hypothetical protein